jgi:anti-repressor protein
VEDIPWMSNCEEKSLSIRSVGDLANHLSKMGKEITPDGLFRWLREKGYLIKSGRDKNLPTELAMDMELFEVDKRSYIAKDGSNCLIRTTKVTGKGQVYFVNKLLARKE